MNVYYLSLKPETPNNDYWDYGFLNDFIKGNVWRPPDFPEFKTHEVSKLPGAERAIVVLPARHHKGYEEKLNKELDNIEHVVLFLMGDEEADFEASKISHPSIHIWVQNPHPGVHDDFDRIGCGYPPQLEGSYVDKDLNVFFSGQMTHKRRIEMIDGLRIYERGDKKTYVNTTKGFTQGLKPPTYYEHMNRAKVVPAPSGAVIPDSFRLFEALECMAIPIADEVNPSGDIQEYWDWLFDQPVPFPKIKEWSEVGSKINEELEAWPENMHRIAAWWMNYKREFSYKVVEQLWSK